MWPVVDEMDVPASTMRGPTAHPRAIASRRPKVTPSSEPRLRTVVKPACRVLPAFQAASYDRNAMLSVTPASCPSTPARSEVRWTCESISPGSTKRSERSISLAPAGGATKPSCTDSMRPARTMMVMLRRGGRPGRSSRVPAWMTTSSAAAAAGGGAGAVWAIEPAEPSASKRKSDRIAARRIGEDPHGRTRRDDSRSAASANAKICQPPAWLAFRLLRQRNMIVALLRRTDTNAVPLEQHRVRSEEHTSELQSPCNLVSRRLLEKKKAIAGHLNC